MPIERLNAMDEIRQCIREAAEYLDRSAGVLNKEGQIIACTNEAEVGTQDAQGLAFVTSEVRKGVADQRSYKRLGGVNGEDYVCFVDGTDNSAGIYLDLLTAWIRSQSHDERTEAERDLLLKNILLENELPGDIPLKAREYQISNAARRVAYRVHVEVGENSQCVEILNHMFPNRRQDFVMAMDEETIVLLKELKRDERDKIEHYANEILDTINSESMARVRIGIGMPVDILKDCARSYREASLALTVGSIFESESYLMRYDKLGLGRLIYQLPPTLCQMFLTEVFPTGSYEQLDSETLKTIQKFFENNLNGSETSRQLFVHRNTLVYRLDKVQKITNLDLRSFDDAVLFKLASMVRKYLEKQNKLQGQTARTGSGRWWK